MLRWGSAGTPLQRLLEPAYGDGIGTPRQVNEVNHAPLPNSFRSAFSLHEMNSTESRTNAMFLFLGDFIAHDFAKTAKLDDEDCGCDTTDPDKCINLYVNPILNVTVNPNLLTADVLEFWLNKFNTELCDGFARSIDIKNTRFPCRFKTREQFNIVTHWLDMSQIYGSSDEDSDRARMFHKGLLNYGFVSDRQKQGFIKQHIFILNYISNNRHLELTDCKHCQSLTKHNALR